MSKNNLRILLFTVTLMVASHVHSQSLIPVFNGAEHAGGDTLTMDTTDPYSGFMKAVIGVKNKGNTGVDVKVKKTSVSVLPGSQNLFCWGTYCYSANTGESLYAVNIPSNTTNQSFYAEYVPTPASVGKSILEYLFYDFMNVSNSAKVIVKFVEGKTAIHEIQTSENFSVYVNPGTGTIHVSCCLSAGATLVIYNFSGQAMGEFPLKTEYSTVELPFRLKKGIYLCSLIRLNKIILNRKFFAL